MLRVWMIAALVVLGLSCDSHPWFFSRDHRLSKLEVAVPGQLSPVAATFSPDGQRLYFIASPSAGFPTDGPLWCAASDGSSARELVAQTVCAVSASPTGSQVALATGWALHGGRLLVLNVESMAVDTLGTEYADIFDVVYGKADPGRIFYASREGGIRSIGADGTDDRAELPDARCYFDLTPADSIVYPMESQTEPWPAVHPDGRYVVYHSWVYGETEGWRLLDLQTGEDTRLDGRPYFKSQLSHPRWTPDGSRLVFSALEVGVNLWGGPTLEGPAELWVLDDVFGK